MNSLDGLPIPQITFLWRRDPHVRIMELATRLDEAEMGNAPREFNWVKAKAACSTAQIFTELRLGVEGDIVEINHLRGGSVDKEVRLATNGNGDTFVVLRGKSPQPSVRFRLIDDRIEIQDGNGTPLAMYRVSLNNEGRCVLISSEGDVEQWQVRRAALEGLFFNQGIE